MHEHPELYAEATHTPTSRSQSLHMNDQSNLLIEGSKTPTSRRNFLRRAGLAIAIAAVAPTAAAFLTGSRIPRG